MKKMFHTVLALVFVAGFAATGMAAEKVDVYKNTEKTEVHNAAQQVKAASANDLEEMMGEGILYNQQKNTKKARKINTSTDDSGDMFSEGMTFKEHKATKTEPAPARRMLTSDAGDMYSEGIDYREKVTTVEELQNHMSAEFNCPDEGDMQHPDSIAFDPSNC